MRELCNMQLGKLGILILFGIIFCSQSLICAQEFGPEKFSPGFIIGLNIGGAASLADADLDNKFNGERISVDLDDIDVRDTFAMGAVFRYAIWEWLFIGVNLDYTTAMISRFETRVVSGSTTTSYVEKLGRANILSGLAVVEFRIPIETESYRFTPYLFGGGGGNLFLWQDPSGSAYDTEVDPGLALVIGAGVDFPMTPGVTLQLEVNWHYNVTDFETKNVGGSTRYSGELDLSDIRGLVGIRINL